MGHGQLILPLPRPAGEGAEQSEVGEGLLCILSKEYANRSAVLIPSSLDFNFTRLSLTERGEYDIDIELEPVDWRNLQNRILKATQTVQLTD